MARRAPFPQRATGRVGILAAVVLITVGCIALFVVHQQVAAHRETQRRLAAAAADAKALSVLLRRGQPDTASGYWQKPSATLEAAAAGAEDARFRALGTLLVKDGFADAVINLGREMTGGWYNWSERNCPRTEPDCYILVWRHAVDAMRSVPGQHFRFLWTVFPDTAAAIDAWPGTSYVDLVGTDIYDWYGGPDDTYPHTASGQLDHDARWREILTWHGGLNWLARLSKLTGKPAVIPEWGLDFHSFGGKDDPVFITRMLAWLRAHHAIGVYWAVGHVTPSLVVPPGPVLAGLGGYGGNPRAVNGLGLLLGGRLQYTEAFLSDQQQISDASVQPVLTPWQTAGYRLILCVPLVPLTVPSYGGPHEPGAQPYQLADYPDVVAAFRQGISGFRGS
jgi:Glycosyl hydrolase family 26